MISIIIPVYNTEMYLEKCVKSVLAQEGVEKEIILVDDGSTDSSLALCDKLSIEYPNSVRVIHKENEGVSIARNVGIEAAKGDLIAFVDSDDDIEARMLSAFDAAISKYSTGDTILTGYKVVNSDGTVWGHGPTLTALWKRGTGYSELFGSVSNRLDERAGLYYYYLE